MYQLEGIFASLRLLCGCHVLIAPQYQYYVCFLATFSSVVCTLSDWRAWPMSTNFITRWRFIGLFKMILCTTYFTPPPHPRARRVFIWVFVKESVTDKFFVKTLVLIRFPDRSSEYSYTGATYRLLLGGKKLPVPLGILNVVNFKFCSHVSFISSRW